MFWVFFVNFVAFVIFVMMREAVGRYGDVASQRGGTRAGLSC
jgi:hypothetical protein